MKAKSILTMLDKINREIDILGKILITNRIEPSPVKVGVQNPAKLK